MAVNEAATLQSLNPLLSETLEVQVVDLSPQGMSIQLNRHIATQSEVKIRRGSAIVFGQVMYCVPVKGAFRAGIRVKDTFSRSE